MTKKRIKVLITFPAEAVERVRQAVPEVELIQIPGKGDAPAGVEGEILLTPPWNTGNLQQLLERGVRWVHTIGTGVDRFPMELMGDRTLTCARGGSAIPIAEWVVAVMLAFEKRLPDAWITEPPKAWSHFSLGGLYGKTLALVGLGGIGTAVARRVLPFGMEVRAMRRSPAPSSLKEVQIVTAARELLASADHVLLAVPLTPETRHIVNREFLSHLKPGAHLINVARGALVDQDALREALEDDRIACASLDVVDPEPLPAGHWLYTHPKVRFSPHVSWNMPGAFDLLLDTFIENLLRYRDGLPLEGRVDAERGY